ncbi:hypothetical protein D1872_229980 [compost metagenome]
MFQGNIEGLDILARQRRSHRLNRSRDHQRQFFACRLVCPLYPDTPRFNVQGVLRRFQHQRVDSRVDQGDGLFLVAGR